MIKVSDYIVSRIVDIGVRHIFMVTGGGAMHLNDSIGSCSDLQYVCNHNEQACAMAAEGYSRVSKNIGIAVVTSGPGATNTITGVLGCWLDSIPALFISGQVRTGLLASRTGLDLRQLGDQEADIVSIVRSITKYAVVVENPLDIYYHFSKAVFTAKSGRPGPVWLDIPLDVQGAIIDENNLREADLQDNQDQKNTKIIKAATEIIRRISKAERPVLLAGKGIKLSNSEEDFNKVVELLKIPVQTAVGAPDVFPSDHPLFFGRPGIEADRASNFIIQNSDLVVALGARMGIRQVTFNFETFARNAYKIFVDIDAAELKKPLVSPDLAVHCDVKVLLKEVLKQLNAKHLAPKKEWMAWCAERCRRFPVVLQKHRKQKQYVHSYYFVERLSENLSLEDVIVVGNTSARISAFRVLNISKGQRIFGNIGCASMGYDLPAAIGACFANAGKRVVCITGDGSIQMNIQELQTIVHHNLPIKIFVLNNKSYLAIKRTQENYFDGRCVGCDPDTGLSFPNLARLGRAYGLKAVRIENHKEMSRKIRQVLDEDGPVLCDINMSPKQTLHPRLSSQVLHDGRIISKPPEDMFPFLNREEFFENMII